MKKLGFGLMRLPQTDSDYGNVDYERVKKMADRFMAEGFTYFDTAAPYHKGNSEVAFREAVAKRYPRSSYTITDKLSLFMIKSPEEFPAFFQGQLERLGVEYLDYYWLHGLGGPSYRQAEEWHAFDFVQSLKAEGKVKHIGLSFHDKAALLDEILTKHPEMEYVQLQLNYLDWEDATVEARKCYKVATKHRKPVIVMEPIKGGSLVNIPEEAEALFKSHAPELSTASWAIRFAASPANVMMVLSGMSDEAQMEDNLSYMKQFRPLDQQEPEPSKTETQVSLDFGGITVLAEMEDSETTKAFLNRLPLTLSMDRYADREYYAAIPALPENGEAIPDFENGDITYYTTGNSLAIFFGNAGNSHQAGLIRMGRITSDLAAFDSIGDSVEVTIGLAGEEGEREMQRMEKRILGKDLEVSAVGFGCMGMTHTFGAAADKKEMTRILQAAVEQGYTFFDTAEVYVSDDGSDEHNEDLVGAALKPYRDRVKIATKFGIAFKPGGGFLYDTRPEKIRESLETSLRRLQTDHIDLYYLHRYEPGSAIEEVAQVMEQLIREGKILHWGLSTVTEDIIRRAHAVCPVTAVQNIFSMLDRDTEKLLPALEELHIGLVTHCPLAKGFLTAVYDKNSVFPEGDWRGRMELFTEEGIQKRQTVLDLIGAKAQEKNATPAQISLAWLMGKRPWIVPIPGTRKMERMIENGGAANIHLTEAEIVEIDRKLDDFIGPAQ